MKLSKLSNQTNSQDPQAVNSRIFVGNLNTFQCSKTDVERMFQIYGRLAGISMHKGYAFVQFTNPFDARNACHGEDGKTVLSQTLDVNMVAEPKAHQIGRKRQNISKTGNDWDYFYDSYCSSTLRSANSVRPKKRKRLMATTSRLLTDNNCLAAAVAAQHQQLQQQLPQQQLAQPQHHGHNQHHRNTAVAAAVVAAHHQQQHQQQQHQQQVAAVAMAAMANLLPQQQMLLHQQNLLTNANSAATVSTTTSTTPSSAHHGLNVFLQHHQQQQKQQFKQEQQQQQYAVAASGFQLKNSLNTAPCPQNAKSAIVANQTGLANGMSINSNSIAGVTEQMSFGQPQKLIQQQQLGCLMQPLTLTLSPPQQQQQQHQHQHLHHSQVTPQRQSLGLQHQPQEQLTTNNHSGTFKIYSNPDTLICGNCRECFNELSELLDHKRSYCKLRFTCKCQDVALATKPPPTSAKLLCAACKDAFTNPWDLMVHAQAAHMLNIYELGDEVALTEPTETVELQTTGTIPENSVDAATAQTSAVSVPTDEQASEIVNKEPNNNNGKISHSHKDNSSINDNGAINAQRSPSLFGNCKGQSGINDNNDSTAVPAKRNENFVTVNSSSNICNYNISNDCSVSDLESRCMEIKFGICSSPSSMVTKEDQQRDDASLDERMSVSSQTHHSDDIKLLNGSASSRGSSPGVENNNQEQRSCIVRTLSIETADRSSPATTASPLTMIPNGLTLSITNGIVKALAHQ